MTQSTPRKGAAYFTLLLCIWSSFAQAQSDPEAIWNQLLKANGKGVFPPELVVKPLGNRGPAFYSQSTVYLEESLAAALDSAFGKQGESALTYVLAHELAHHNCDHICSHFVRRGLKGTEAERLSKEPEQRRIESVQDETEADRLAGIYGHIAGFRPLDVADSTLSLLYSLYDLPDSIPGYPTLEDRRTIAKNNRNQFDHVTLVYDMAWTTCALGLYDESASLTRSIITEAKYKAPEIYELFALANFLQAVDLIAKSYPRISTWGWPITLSHETNAKGISRSLAPDDWSQVITRLKDAEQKAQEGLSIQSPETQDEGLLKSIQFLIAWAQAPDSFLKQAAKQKASDDISSNHQALALWLSNPNKNQKKALQILSNNQHPTSSLNAELIRGQYSTMRPVEHAECDKLKVKQNTYNLMKSNMTKERVLLGKSLMFSLDKTDGGYDIQLGRSIHSTRILIWTEPMTAPFCWGFETGVTSRDEVFDAFADLPFRHLALQQGSFVSFPSERLTFQFGPDGTLSFIAWKSL